MPARKIVRARELSAKRLAGFIRGEGYAYARKAVEAHTGVFSRLTVQTMLQTCWVDAYVTAIQDSKQFKKGR